MPKPSQDGTDTRGPKQRVEAGEWLSLQDAARLLRVSRGEVYRSCREGEFRFLLHGKPASPGDLRVIDPEGGMTFIRQGGHPAPGDSLDIAIHPESLRAKMRGPGPEDRVNDLLRRLEAGEWLKSPEVPPLLGLQVRKSVYNLCVTGVLAYRTRRRGGVDKDGNPRVVFEIDPDSLLAEMARRGISVYHPARRHEPSQGCV